MIALRQVRELGFDCEIGVCPQGRRPLPLTQGRVEGTGMVLCTVSTFLTPAPQEWGSLGSDQGMGLGGGEEGISRSVPSVTAAPCWLRLSSMACALHLSTADTHVAAVSPFPLREGKHFLKGWWWKRETGSQKGGCICLDDKPRTKAQSGAFQEGPASS